MQRDATLDVAVVGMAARLPGAADLASWWSRILAGESLVRQYTDAELVEAEVPAALRDHPDYVPARGHLADVDRFDHAFFGIPAREAATMDPQHRLALEVTWQALEDAGVEPRTDQRRTAVFASSTGSSYLRTVLAYGPVDPGTLDDLIHGTETDFMGSRISYRLGLTGPALAVQTACSSSLVGVHLAVQALVNGDCDQAVVVATGLGYPQAGYLHLPGGVLSPSGRCRPFSDAADGVVPGSGVAAVVLRLAEDAARDGLPPHGLILGTAINNDGARKAGYYAPSAAGQEAAIIAALATAGIDGSDLGYLETHGTGTPIGDPIEWSAASAALLRAGARPGQLAVGSTKANVGHLDACAGLAGLIKALLVVRTGQVPPLAGFDAPNPLLEVDGSPLTVPTVAGPWRGPEPRRAAVSAFGIGGTNAHVIVQQPLVEEVPAVVSRPGPVLLAWSAADPEAADRLGGRLADQLDADQALVLADVSHSLAGSRANLPVRRAVTVASRSEAIAALRTVPDPAGDGSGEPALLAVFPGQSAQFPGMGLPYAADLAGFTEILDETLRPLDGRLRDRVRNALLHTEQTSDELADTALAQPALVCLQLAVADALAVLGVRPQAVVGHSLGELSAAVVAGLVERDAAVAFSAERGRALQATPPGRMLAVGCGEARTRELIAGTELELAAVNAADNCVVAGPAAAVAALADRLDGQVFTRVLRTSRAFHSALIDSALPVLAGAAAGLGSRPASRLFGSASEAILVEPGDVLSPSFWTDQARRPVRFADTVSQLAGRLTDPVALEIGPGRGLSMAVEQAGVPSMALNPVARPDETGDVLAGLGELWRRGLDLDLAALTPGGLVRLPGYPFAGPVIRPPRPDGPATAQPANAIGGADTEAGDEAPEPPPTSRDAVTTAWLAAFGITDLPADADFFRLGGDSLLVTRLARQLNDRLGIRLPIRRLLVESSLEQHISLVEAERTAQDAAPSV